MHYHPTIRQIVSNSNDEGLGWIPSYSFFSSSWLIPEEADPGPGQATPPPSARVGSDSVDCRQCPASQSAVAGIMPCTIPVRGCVRNASDDTSDAMACDFFLFEPRGEGWMGWAPDEKAVERRFAASWSPLPLASVSLPFFPELACSDHLLSTTMQIVIIALGSRVTSPCGGPCGQDCGGLGYISPGHVPYLSRLGPSTWRKPLRGISCPLVHFPSSRWCRQDCLSGRAKLCRPAILCILIWVLALCRELRQRYVALSSIRNKTAANTLAFFWFVPPHHPSRRAPSARLECGLSCMVARETRG